MHLGIIKITYNTTARPRCLNVCNAFYGRLFREPRRGGKKKKKSICYWLFKCGVLRVCVCACVWERERQGHISDTVESAFLISACVQTHRSFITVSVTWFCSPFGLELMVKLRTLLTVFTFIWKDEARNYEKGILHFRWVLAVFGQSQCTVPVGQSEQTALVGRRDFVENDTFERGGA